MPNPYFKFKKFTVFHDQCAMKVGTDGVLLGSWADVESEPKTIIDIGAGTGLIALMLAQRFESANIEAVEIEENCANQCRDNIASSPFGDRINVHNQSIQEFAKTNSQKFDLLVSNPPFFIDAFVAENQERNLARHNTSLNQHDLWQVVSSLSHQRSVFVVILPVTEGEMFEQKAKEYPWFLKRKCNVKGAENAKVKRVLLEFCRTQTLPQTSNLIIEKQRSVYTSDFINLVKNFYLHL